MFQKLSKLFSLALIAAIALSMTPNQTLPVQAATSDLFFSEYVEGSSYDKALEIYNGTGAAIDLATGGYTVQFSFNGGSSTASYPLTGSVANNDVYVVTATNVSTTLGAYANQQFGTAWFNGDDAIVLWKGGVGGTIVDVIGQVGTDPGTKWGTSPTSTADNTLRRKADVCAGDIDGSNAFDPSAEWDGYAQNTFDGLGTHTSNCGGGSEAAPTVSSVTPVDGATGIAITSDITVNFSEDVTVTGAWFDITCTDSGAHTAAVTGGPTAFTLNPDADFVEGESCTLTIYAAHVADQDLIDPPDTLAADFTATFSTNSPTITKIHEVQGNGAASLLVGQTVVIEGIVIGDFQDGASGVNGDFNGFHIQEEDADADADALSSEGIFVYDGSAPSVNVQIGDLVRVEGAVSEYNGLTEITSYSGVTVISSGNPLPTPISLSLPVTSVDDFEAYEGMYVTFPQALIISEYFNFDRYGEIVLTSQRHLTPTAQFEPGPAAIQAAQDFLLDKITLDDGRSTQNPDPAIHPNGNTFDLTNLFRGGDTVQNVTGIMDYSFSLYRIQPTQGADYVAANPRTTAPAAVGGSLKVVGMNTLNFFITPDYPTGNALDNKCGPLQNVECRGADFDQPDEFTRQRSKLLAAISGLNADIVGLNELENTLGVDPLGDPTNGVVAGLNEIFGAGTYAYIDTGVIGTDAIRVGMIYKPANVTPIGSFKLLTSSVDPRFDDTKSRPALAQTFEEVATGARFTVVINHLKSKGSACGAGDPDLGDGAGNCNLTRKAAAQALVDWLATDPTGSLDSDFLIIGDLNSYDKEDPIDAIKAGPDDLPGTSDDYTDMVFQFQGEAAYSYVFDGQTGYLDHALASASLAGQITGVADWHINADEADLIDYDTSFKLPNQDALYAPDAYRASDHDPVIVGLNLNAPPTVSAGGPYSVDEGSNVSLTAAASDPNGDALTVEWDLDNNGSFETPGVTVPFNGVDGPAAPIVNVRVSDGVHSVEATVSVTVNNLAPVVGTVSVPASPTKVGGEASISASFTDAGVLDTHTALVDWGDGNTSSGIVAETNGSGSVAGSHSYTTPGLYTVTLTVTDKDGASHQASSETFVIYDPKGGFVTGGGFFNSPAGAYLAKPTKKGLAVTAFAVKYLRNASIPTGAADFIFLAGNLQFRATSFDWLVIDQTEKTAQFQGSGKINGQAGYKFMIWADDNGHPDTFRIKIWKVSDGTVVYDNDSLQPLSGGSIVVHK